MTKATTNQTTIHALRYQADFIRHLEERLQVSEGTARALLASWLQGLTAPSAAAARDSVQAQLEDWVEAGLERVALAEVDFDLR